MPACPADIRPRRHSCIYGLAPEGHQQAEGSLVDQHRLRMRRRRRVGMDAAYAASSISCGPCLAKPVSELPKPPFQAASDTGPGILPTGGRADPAGVPGPDGLGVPPAGHPLSRPPDWTAEPQGESLQNLAVVCTS